MSDKNFPIHKRAFTITNDNICRRLITKAKIFYDNKNIEIIALWDTGATGSCISESVVKDLSLIPTGKQDIQTPSGKDTFNTYLVDIELPNNVLIKNVVVCDSQIGKQGLGLLVGMDIITQGDFIVNNRDDKTIFSFSIPPTHKIDFVKEINLENLIGPKHGQGKRRKK